MTALQNMAALARRSVDRVLVTNQDLDADNPFGIPFAKLEAAMQDVSPAGLVFFTMTLFAFGLMLVSIRYTLWTVVGTLAMVESPNATYQLQFEEAPPAYSDDPLAKNVIETEISVVQQKPITSKIRRTIRHLQARAGWRSRWRGLSLAIVYAVVYSVLKQVFGILTTRMASNVSLLLIANALAGILAHVALARWHMTFTHILISEPSPKPWFRHMPSLKVWRKIALPTALNALALEMAIALPAILFFAVNLNNDGSPKEASRTCIVPNAVFSALGCALMGFVIFVGIFIPSEVALVRVHASMLPLDVDTIVPFDRTFNGRAKPNTFDSTSAIFWTDAWRSFDRASRSRILKMYGKFVLIEVVLHVVMAAIIVSEAVVVFGPAFKKAREGKYD